MAKSADRKLSSLQEQSQITKYKLSEEALQFIIGESQDKFPNETGGILVGKVNEPGVFIHHAIGPGQNAQHSPNRFKRDGDYSQKELDAMVEATDGEYDYVGEWHSHLFNARPSFIDIQSMYWIAKNDKYATNEPILLLYVYTGVYSWKIQCYVMTKKRLRKLSR